MSERFYLERPKNAFADGTEMLQESFDPASPMMGKVDKIVFDTAYPEYLYWDNVKYKPFDVNKSHEAVWAAIKIQRKFSSVVTPIKTEQGQDFRWYKNLPRLEEFLHEMDLNMGGNLSVGKIDEKNKRKFIARGIVEEAIASSQLEGASTTRKLAKQFLKEGRKPRTHAEHMILNNYQAMQAIDEDFKNKELTLGLLFELHAMVVKGTVDVGDLQRFRRDSEQIVVEGGDGKFIYHVPPSVKFMEQEIERFLKFANDDLTGGFIHPVIKAIMLHFWIGYLHPFTDGNGRLARLIFYWYLLKNNYWAFIYLPISTIIRQSPVQYAMAYVYSEQDDFDLTYFIDYNIRKIKMAQKDFERYTQELAQKSKKIQTTAQFKYNLNERQLQSMQFFWENREEYTTPTMYMKMYQVSKSTAIRDLQYLLKKEFVYQRKMGRKTCYFAAEKISELFCD
jgi:Fic family protein